MYLGVDTPVDVLVGAAIGVTIPLLAFRWFTPNDVFPVSYRRGRTAHLDVGGARGEAIRRALSDQLGLEIEEVKPFGLAGSAGSTPLRIKVSGDPPTILFGKLYARSHLRSDRWYKLGRELLYGRLEDEKPFHTVRRLVQQEDYALHKLHLAGLPSPRPYGFVELTPDREYLLVTEFFDGAVELGDAEVDEGVIDDGLGIIRKLWDAGLAHRDIKPANLLVRDGRMLLIDVAFVESRPTPWRQAVDLANMMLCLALRSDPGLVYERAQRQFSVEEITEAFAATRGLAMPSQLRHMLRAQGRDLHAEFLGLLPEQPAPISIQRFSLRRLGLALLVLCGLLVVVPMVVNWAVQTDRVNTSLYTSDIGCDDQEALWLMAQAVPSASAVPCVQLEPERLVPQRRQGGQRVRQHRLRRRPALPGGGGDGGAAPVLRPGRVDRGQLRPAGGQALHPHRPHRHPGPGHPLLRLPGRLHHRAVRLRRQPPSAWPARPPPPSASSPATSWPATSTGAPPAACNWTRPRRRPWVRTRTPSTPSRWSSARSSRASGASPPTSGPPRPSSGRSTRPSPTGRCSSWPGTSTSRSA